MAIGVWWCTTYIANNISSGNKYNNLPTIIIKHQYLTLLFISLDTDCKAQSWCEDEDVILLMEKILFCFYYHYHMLSIPQ